MSFEVYQEKKQETMEILKKTCDAVESETIKHFIEQKLKNLQEDRFIISVFGHFSNGKSKFLNTLMGFETQVLVEDELACTATITRLCAPERKEHANHAEVIFMDETKKVVPMEELAQYSSRKEDYGVEGKIRQVSLFIDSEYLKNGVEIVDTPGFNSVLSIHTDIARNYVEKSDASIFLFATDKPGSEPEFTFLKHVRHYMNRIFFIMNKIDLCDYSDNVDKLADDLKEKMHLMKIPMQGKTIYPISAKWAQETIGQPNEEKRQKSRFDVFVQALNTYLTNEENVKDRLYAPLEAYRND